MTTPPTLTEQLRLAVAAVPAYSLAKRAGVPLSTITRFVKGQRSITLDAADRLAAVLGLVLAQTVADVPRSGKRGRPSKKDAAMVAANSPNLTETAQALALAAHTDYFHLRRGVFGLPDLGKVCLFNNNPYADDPGRRDRETGRLRSVLRKEGWKEEAYATYPGEGEDDAGYTYAMLLTPPARLRTTDTVLATETARTILHELFAASL